MKEVIPPLHGVCTLFRLMRGQEWDDFCLDIELHGVKDPVWTWVDPSDGIKHIIDGQNRAKALVVANRRREERGEPPWPLPEHEWDGDGSLVEFVMSRNLHRRHLDESERGMMGARAAVMLDLEAENRRKAGLKRGQQHPPPIEANGTKGRTSEKAAKLANVSRTTVERAQRVLAKGVQQLADAVDAGEISVSKASEIAKLTPTEQVEKIRQEGRQAKQDVDRIDLADHFDRWTKTCTKLLRQYEACKPAVPELVRWMSKAVELHKIAMKRVVKPKGGEGHT